MEGSAPLSGVTASAVRFALLLSIAVPGLQLTSASVVPWYLGSGVRFDCTGCSKCCKVRGEVWATDDEARAMAKAVGVTDATFRARYVMPERTPAGWQLIGKRGDGGCVFLDGEGKCSVYAGRPLQCRAFPFWPEVSGRRDTWEAEAVLPDSVKGPGPRWSATTGGCEGISDEAAWIPGPLAALRELEYTLYEQKRVRALEPEGD
jgi:hypothetical protein